MFQYDVEYNNRRLTALTEILISHRPLLSRYKLAQAVSSSAAFANGKTAQSTGGVGWRPTVARECRRQRERKGGSNWGPLADDPGGRQLRPSASQEGLAGAVPPHSRLAAAKVCVHRKWTATTTIRDLPQENLVVRPTLCVSIAKTQTPVRS